MSFWNVVVSLLEVAIVLFTVWAVFHEDRFIAIEEKLFRKIKRRRMRVIAGGKQQFN